MSSPPARTTPDFLILGAQKAGTTSLFEYLAGHPAVIRPATKELHYFTLYHDHGPAWYHRELRADTRTPERGWTFEASPYYLFHPAVPARCAACCPATRLILLVRDPATRALSHYRHEVRLGYEPLPMEAAFAAEVERLRTPLDTPDGLHAHRHWSYRARSRYAEQIEAWLNYFPARQMLVIQSELFFAQPARVLHDIQDFLGLPDAPPARPMEHLNAGPTVETSATFVRELRRSLEAESEKLARLLRHHWGQELRLDLWNA